ncbi:MAG: DUF2254 domain-containing protein, partial [Deltaproteobacteria bacterium]|nr:DUF2254 domain-containing protein [Deltaproteobacteria bacterium]
TGVVFVFFGITTVIDLGGFGGFYDLMLTLLSIDAQTAQGAVGNLPEVIIGILGLTLTVSAIVVQLAAQRYTPKLVDLFLADKMNIFTIFAMVFSSVYCVWILYAIRSHFVPTWGIIFLMALTTMLLVMLIPYFRYVFQFLTPSNILGAIENNQEATIRSAAGKETGIHLEKIKNHAAMGLDQVSDIALSAVTQVDRNVALMSIDTLCLMVRKYIPQKSEMNPDWFQPKSSHFISISSEFLEEIARRKVWVEARGLMNLELIFNQALKNMPDAISAIATNTRQIALTAEENQDGESLYFCLEYFNTYLRRAVNDRNQRAVFTLFYQYRRLGESLLAGNRPLADEIAHFIHYYGQESMRGGIPFLMLVAAMDIGTLLQIGYRSHIPNLDTILDNFLSMSDSAEVKKVPFVHKGVRKAHVILAANLLSEGNHRPTLSKIHQSLMSETKEWLGEVKTELMAVQKAKFWEITDRGGINFEYMTPDMKKWLEEFYAKYLDK